MLIRDGSSDVCSSDLLPAEDQLPDDLLRPGGAGFGIAGDHHVVRPEAEVVPDGGIEMVAVHLPGLARPLRHRSGRRPRIDCVHPLPLPQIPPPALSSATPSPSSPNSPPSTTAER